MAHVDNQGDDHTMEFLGTAVNLFIVIGGLMIARDWLVGLRADVAQSRQEIAALKGLILETREGVVLIAGLIDRLAIVERAERTLDRALDEDT